MRQLYTPSGEVAPPTREYFFTDWCGINDGMANADSRRDVLRNLIRTRYHGVARHLAIAAGKPEGQINDMLSNPPRKSFGEKVARQLEDKLALPTGYFDRPEASHEPAGGISENTASVYGLWPSVVTQIAEIARDLPESMQQQLLGQAKMLQSEFRVTQANPALRAGRDMTNVILLASWKPRSII